MVVERTNKARVLRRVRGFVTDGTLDIMAGSLLAGLSAYAYQILAGRALGEVDFAPMSALLTLHFLAFAVVLLPVEQLVIRRMTLETANRGVPRVAVGTVAVTAAAVGLFAVLTRNRLFAGDAVYGLLAAGTVITHGVFSVGRGRLAGFGRYRAYGLVSGGAGVVRLILAAVILTFTTTAVSQSWALVAGALVILAVPGSGRGTPVKASDESAGRMLVGLVLASAASQALLLAGTLVVGGLTEEPAVVSIVFATFTLFRAPLVFGYNLIARVLPAFTAMVSDGRNARLVQWAKRFAGVGFVGALAAGFVGAISGPIVIEIAFGSEFRPDAAFSGTVAAGVVMSAAGLFVGQVLVARGDSSRLAGAWMGAVAAAALGLLLPVEDPALRVGVAFLVGESAALVLLIAGAIADPAEGGRADPASLKSRAAKRVFDTAVAGVALVVAMPLMAVIAIIIRLDSPGPVVFRQARVGRSDRVFNMWKFRTMLHGADEELLTNHLRRLADVQGTDEAGTLQLRIEDDPRVTRVGRRLRAWSLDELPNLWNVAKGDMALVGPRPLVPEEVELMAPESRRRTIVRPGITGWAQIQGRDEIDMAERTRYDLEYLEIRSFALDLMILARTALAVFTQKGA